MLDSNYKCENCFKTNCKQLEWDKERKEWVCSDCEDEFLKEENEKKHK